ncbi:hypothetical protein B0A55_04883 [Friedmanniomyces simplex]|uniref:Uncharacterized protein n=1 Tax=Friedmanniomyces simplex TaxID=329884 RepID=A0A4U0XIX5_9PEZI|nr:hypothetical protein B0A55_04883 [Friedmanniomyces simplex]
MEPEDPPKKAASASGKNRARSIPTLVVSPPSLRVSSTDARGTGRNVGGSQTRSATRTAGGRSEDDLAPNLRQHSTSEYDALKVPHDWSRSHDKPGYGTTPETNPAYAWKPPDRDDDDEETASQWSRATRAPTMLPDMSTPMPVNLEEYSRDRSHNDDGFLVTEGPTDYQISYATSTGGATGAYTESCSLSGSSYAVCVATLSLSADGTKTAVSTTATASGSQLHYGQFPITAGADKLASATGSCMASGNAAVPTGVMEVYKVLVAPAAAALMAAGALL